MKFLYVVAMALGTTLPEKPYEDERVFERPSELVPWCREEVEAYFVAQGVETYQTTVSHKSVGKMLIVEGKIRAGGRDVAFTCRVAKCGRERYATVQIH